MPTACSAGLLEVSRAFARPHSSQLDQGTILPMAAAAGAAAAAAALRVLLLFQKRVHIQWRQPFAQPGPRFARAAQRVWCRVWWASACHSNLAPSCVRYGTLHPPIGPNWAAKSQVTGSAASRQAPLSTPRQTFKRGLLTAPQHK